MLMVPDLTVNTRGRFVHRNDSYWGNAEYITHWSCFGVRVTRHALLRQWHEHAPEILVTSSVRWHVRLGSVLHLARTLATYEP